MRQGGLCPCNQGGEVLNPCTKRNLIYENLCLLCHPGAEGKKVVLKVDKETMPSIYVGESCRSLYERSLEHWRNFKDGELDSHILKHHVIHHGGVGDPKFHIGLVSFHRTALSRQVGEAVRIGKRGSCSLALNSKGEWNRCEIPRLSLVLDNKTAMDYGEDNTLQEEENKAWVRKKNSNKDTSQKKIEKLRARTLPAKNKKKDDLEDKLEDDQKVPKKKRRLHDLVVGWGEKKAVTTPIEQPAMRPYQPLEQRLVVRPRGCRQVIPAKQPDNMVVRMSTNTKDSKIRSYFARKQMLAPKVQTPLNTQDVEKTFADEKTNHLPDVMREDKMKEPPSEMFMMSKDEHTPPPKPGLMMMNLPEAAPSSNRKRKLSEEEDDHLMCHPNTSSYNWEHMLMYRRIGMKVLLLCVLLCAGTPDQSTAAWWCQIL